MADPLAIESPQALINRARYAGKDFFTFVDDLIARIQIQFITEFNDFVASGTGQMLIDIVSWAAETLSFYIDRQATESYITTARTRKALNRLARNIGYKPSAAISAAVDLTVLLDDIWAFDVPIEVGFQFSGPNRLVFEATEEVIFPTGEGPLSPARTVATREGVTRTETFTSTGAKNQIFRLNPGEGKSVAAGTAAVTVDGSLWTESEIITFDQTDQYELSENDVPPLLRFGDAVAGNIPVASSALVITYVATSGAGGLVNSATIDDVESPLVVAFQAIDLTITNVAPSSGGSDQESLESIRANAPNWFKARDVAVTRGDYEGLAGAFADPLAGAVAVAQAFVARSADEDLTLRILLDNIRSISEPLSANVQVETATARTSTNTIVTEQGSIDSEVSNLDTALDAIVTSPLTASPTGDAIDARTTAQNVRSDVTDADVLADEGLAQVTLVNKDARFSSIKTLLSGMNADLDTIVSKMGDVEQSVSDANAASTAISASTALISTAAASVLTDLDDIDALVGAQFETAIETELQAIFDHADGFLSADCKANLVQVPILTRDVDGFLTAPPVALQRSLETHLSERKEVTQVVEVMSGENFLIAADINITLGIFETFVRATILSTARGLVDNLLKTRVFGESLRVSDVYTLLVPDRTGRGGINGVDWGIIKIVGPATKIDVDGNLVITSEEIITRGTVTYVAQTVSTTTGATIS